MRVGYLGVGYQGRVSYSGQGVHRGWFSRRHPTSLEGTSHFEMLYC